MALYNDMHPAFVLTVLALGISGCSDRNLLGEKVWHDEQLAQAEVGFGWNYEVASEERPSRNIDIVIQPDNSFEIQISEYRKEPELDILSRTDGNLAPTVAAGLRRNLAQLRSRDDSDLFTTLPNCTEWSHPAIEYYVGFKIAQKTVVTIIERDCDTPETLKGRKVVTEAMAAFPQVDRTKLVAGSFEL